MPTKIVRHEVMIRCERSGKLWLARQKTAREAVSPHTVRHHAENVFAKLGVHSRRAIEAQMRPRSGGD
jgi:hypothetical protein